MKIKFNPTGTHMHKGFLKVRLDLYPAKTDKTYDMQKVKGKINPCLCHFVVVDTDISLADLEMKATQIFDNGTVLALDNALSIGDIAQVSQIMGTKCGSGEQVGVVDFDTVNSRLSSLEVEV